MSNLIPDNIRYSTIKTVKTLPVDVFLENFYDFEFTLKQNATEKTEGFLIMGAKNVNGSNLVWNNNNSTSEED